MNILEFMNRSTIFYFSGIFVYFVKIYVTTNSYLKRECAGDLWGATAFFFLNSPSGSEKYFLFLFTA